MSLFVGSSVHAAERFKQNSQAPWLRKNQVCFGCPDAIEESVSVQVGPGYASSHTRACEGSAKRLGFPSAPRSHVGLPSPTGSWNQGARGRSTNQSPLIIGYIAMENHL